MSDPAPAVVVTGTGTEIGKTMVAAGLARALADRGLEVRAVKPVESGTDEMERDREDGVLLARAARQEEPAEALVRLRAPLAPPVAAGRESREARDANTGAGENAAGEDAAGGAGLSMERWVERIRELSAGADVTLVEGAGGVLSPLTWDATARDLAAALDAPALLVAPDRLGCLTHTLTALEALEARGVPVLGVVYSAPPEEGRDASTGGNPATLARFADVDRIARLGRVADFREAAVRLGEVADWVEEAAGTTGGTKRGTAAGTAEGPA